MDDNLRINLLQICVFLLSFTSSAFGSQNSLFVDLHALTARNICSTAVGMEKFTSGKPILKVVDRYGPCSTLAPLEKSSLEQILAEDQSRVDSIHRRVSAFTTKEKAPGPMSSSLITATSGSSYGTGNYIVSVGIGTPSKTQTIIFDTGSDVTWVQCEPCQGFCHQQKDPIYDPSQSSTFADVPCDSTQCEAVTSGCSGSSCLYNVGYGDRSYTFGYYAEDTLTITPDVIQNFRFGCGQNNSKQFGEVAGLLGLGPGAESFVSQTSDTYQRVFAYCLPASGSTGYLTFGTSSDMSNTQQTPIVEHSTNPTHYYISMTGITVAGQTLQIASTVFSNAGMIIDSGTVITRLPPDAYQALRSAFREQMKQYNMVSGTSVLLDTCYDFTGFDNILIPSVGVQFSNGVTLDLTTNGVLYWFGTSTACLAFAANSDPSEVAIFGNVQQRTFEVVYDIPNGEIGFSPKAC